MKLLKIVEIVIEIIDPHLRNGESCIFKWSVHHFLDVEAIVQVIGDLREILFNLLTAFGTIVQLVLRIKHLTVLNFPVVFGLIFFHIWPRGASRINFRRIWSLI